MKRNLSRIGALMPIKGEFQANGIGFALPMVQVSGDGSDAAAAQRAFVGRQGRQGQPAE